MKFVPVDKLPPRGTKRLKKKKPQDFLEAFLKSDAKIARVEFTSEDYKSADSCQSSLRNVVQYTHLPIKVLFRSGEVFLAKI